MGIRERIKHFFFPESGAPRWRQMLPFVVLGILAVIVLGTGTYGWEYSNSPQFCGTTCHTMPPQNATYLKSPHANVTCEECHIGRASLPDQMMRKTQGIKEAYYMIFHLYEYPIRASALQPARDTCEKCHQPETFSGDSLRTITRFGGEPGNSPETIYLLLKTGGGAKREGLGRGIHWHIVNQVKYYATDSLEQDIPFVRVNNEDGTTVDYVDIESNFDVSSIDEGQLKEIDCVTCHNRVTHEFKYPSESMDEAMSRKLIDPAIPDIHTKGVEVLSVIYDNQEQGLTAITGLENYYKTYYADFYNSNTDVINTAISQIQSIYKETVFIDQKINWETHPNNLGHMNSPGCFRCHDGKHLDNLQQAIRLECNLCHAVPVVAGPADFVANIEISRGIEPESHRNPNWISLHNQAFDATCANCHTTESAGSTDNNSFCSNSACHGSVYTYAGFDAPKLREILLSQLPTPEPIAPPAPVSGISTFDANIGPIFAVKCAMCHGAAASAGLNLSTYADTMKGGQGGPAILAGNSAGSKLIQVQNEKHFANLSPEELELAKQWIDAGAPEK
jgi:nitrate/TMAO reductase-like tetraheme cytochrome c subunit